jgi:RNA recognition motif-containing protein
MEENKKKKKNNTNVTNTKKDFLKPYPQQKYIIPQNETLYVNHLNEKIKIDLLRENLYYLFSQFGDVLEINVRKSKKMRGQAFIVYKDINEATRAKVSLNNFLFLGSRISVDYAKTKSDIIVKIKGQQNSTDYKQTGTYISRKRNRMKEYGNIKDDDEYDEGKKSESIYEDEESSSVQKSLKSKKNKKKKIEKNDVEEEDKIEKNNNNIELNEEEDIDGECINENKILFVTGLGKEINEKMIEVVFSQFKGLKDIRFFSERGFCFVEYDNEVNAGTALMSLNNMKLTENSTIKITYALKK